MDSRLVFRPRPHMLKPTGTPGGSPGVPTGQGTLLGCGPLARGGEGPGRSGDFGQGDGCGPERARKAGGGAGQRPYRKPTLVGGCKCTEVGERTFVKELGNLTP